MPDTRVQLVVEIETEGAEQLTTLRRELEQVGSTGQSAFKGLDRSLRDALETQKRFAASFEPVFGNFFRRLLSGATSFRDAFKKLLADLLDFFLRTVSKMVAAWLGGFRQLSGGGLLIGLLSQILGGSGGGGAQSGLGAFASFLPFLPAGGGGGGSATNLGLLSALGINLRSLGPVSGNFLLSGGLLGLTAGFQSGSRTLGALGGAAAGFAFGGPVGAAIGAAVGFFAGLFGRGKKKRQAARAEQELRRQLEETLSQFRSFQLDFESALNAVNQAFASFQQAVAPLGKAGRRAVKNSTPRVQATIDEINKIQEARHRRAALIGGLPIPEFKQGGLVGQTFLSAAAGTDGKLLAFLHQGEAVLNQRAVQRLGADFVQRANSSFSAPSPVAPATGSTVNIQPGAIVVNAAPGMDAEELAGLTLRQLDRRLRDAGLRLGN